MKNERYVVNYGYDPIPGGGYFFQVQDKQLFSYYDEGYIIDEGFARGIEWLDMLTWMANIHVWGFTGKLPDEFKDHVKLVAENKPI